MSNYDVNDYINKKFNDICKDTPVIKAYVLGMAVGFLECYKETVHHVGQENANEVYKNILNGTEEFNIIFRTLVGLYNKDTNSKVESMIEIFERCKKPEKTMSDEHKDLIEEFLEFLHKKGV